MAYTLADLASAVAAYKAEHADTLSQLDIPATAPLKVGDADAGTLSAPQTP